MSGHFYRAGGYRAPRPLPAWVIERWLEWLCPLPRPLVSYEELQHAEHHDLREREAADLHRERRRIHLRLDLDDAPPAWLTERVAAIDAELRRRGARGCG